MALQKYRSIFIIFFKDYQLFSKDMLQVFIRKEGDAPQIQDTTNDGACPVSPLSMTIEYDVFECDDFGK